MEKEDKKELIKKFEEIEAQRSYQYYRCFFGKTNIPHENQKYYNND